MDTITDQEILEEKQELDGPETESGNTESENEPCDWENASGMESDEGEEDEEADLPPNQRLMVSWSACGARSFVALSMLRTPP